MIDHVAALLLGPLSRGETNAFSRRIYVGRGPRLSTKSPRYRLDPEFRATVDRYVQEFEGSCRLSQDEAAKPLPRHISCRRLQGLHLARACGGQTGLNA